MTPSAAEVNAEMSRVVAALKAQHAAAFNDTVGKWLDSAGKTAVMSALQVDLDRILKLDGPQRMAVLYEEMLPSKWFAIAAVVADDIKYQTGVAAQGAYSPGRFWDEVVAQTAADARDKVKTAAPWVLVAGAALLALVLVVKLR